MNAESRIDARFAGWLLRETGISAPTLGANALERAVWERVQATRCDIEGYWQRLNESRDERQALVELIVVPETWFFREREAFVALARLANERLVCEPSRVLRVLSAPCSSGEEPYSVAMALLDAGIGAERFSIDAVDISERALEVARRGVYGRNSFRGRALEFRDRHFAVAGADAAEAGRPYHASGEVGYRLSERVRDAVRFAQANLFDAPQPGDARFDFIFCRNVLIYFDRDAQDRAIRLLDARLARDGMLFVGPAETGLMMRHAYSPARIPLAFAFRRSPDDAPQLKPVRAVPAASVASVAPFGPIEPIAPVRPVPPTGPRPVRPTRPPYKQPLAQAFAQPFVQPHRPSPSVGGGDAAGDARTTRIPPTSRVAASAAVTASTAATAADPRAKSAALLADALRLADAGRLEQAERAANQCVVIHGPDAAAFYLLGLIMDARGRGADASDYYRKALYLEPNHYEALTHLAALLEMSGDATGAERMTRRAERAAQARRETPERRADRTRG